jgi:hypothetical protein
MIIGSFLIVQGLFPKEKEMIQEKFGISEPTINEKSI